MQVNLRTKRATRGYLLLESIVAGGILTVCIGTALVLSSSFRASVTGASRRAEAAQLAESRVEQFLAGDTRVSFGPEPLAGHHGFTVEGTATSQAIGAGSMTSTMRAVTVTVRYPVSGTYRTLTVRRQVR